MCALSKQFIRTLEGLLEKNSDDNYLFSGKPVWTVEVPRCDIV